MERRKREGKGGRRKEGEGIELRRWRGRKEGRKREEQRMRKGKEGEWRGGENWPKGIWREKWGAGGKEERGQKRRRKGRRKERMRRKRKGWKMGEGDMGRYKGE